MKGLSINDGIQLINEVLFSYESSPQREQIPDMDKRIRLLKKQKKALVFHRKPRSVPVSMRIPEILENKHLNRDFYQDRKDYLNLIEKCCAFSPWTVGYDLEDPHFQRNFGFAEFIGPEGVFHSDEIACGFVVMGKNLIYPKHSHPAIELYEVIKGPLTWRIGDEPSFQAEQGQLIHHGKSQLHEMRTGDAPFFGVYTWIGDIHSPSVMKG